MTGEKFNQNAEFASTVRDQVHLRARVISIFFYQYYQLKKSGQLKRYKKTCSEILFSFDIFRLARVSHSFYIRNFFGPTERGESLLFPQPLLSARRNNSKRRCRRWRFSKKLIPTLDALEKGIVGKGGSHLSVSPFVASFASLRLSPPP